MRAQRPALIAGVIGAALSVLGLVIDPLQFFRSYLVGVSLLARHRAGLAADPDAAVHHRRHVGCGAAAHARVGDAHLAAADRCCSCRSCSASLGSTNGRSRQPWRRIPSCSTRALPERSVLSRARGDLLRGLVGVALLLESLVACSRMPTATRDADAPAGDLSRGGLLLYALTMTFASVDWVMSLEPHWFSTIYGILFIGGQVLAAFAFAIPVAAAVGGRDRRSAKSSAPINFTTSASCLLAFVMLWAYFAFSQFLIIWSGNLPEETPWYLSRLRGGWEWVGDRGHRLSLRPAVRGAVVARHQAQRGPLGTGSLRRPVDALRSIYSGWCRRHSRPRASGCIGSISPRSSAWVASGWRYSSGSCARGRCCRCAIRR